MGSKLGLECKVYQNTGVVGGGSPTWVERTNVQDVTIGLTKDSADMSTRGAGGFAQERATLRHLDVTLKILYDPTDAFYSALYTAFMSNTTYVDLALMDGAIATVGSKGWRATFDVFDFKENQPLKEGATVDVTLKPAPGFTPVRMES